MSSSSLYLVYGKTASEVATYRNGWGSAPPVWDWLRAQFLSEEVRPLFGDDKALWALARDERVPVQWRMVHAFCFDWAVCPIARLADLADACDYVGASLPDNGNVNHWPEIAAELRRHARRKDKRLQGISIGCTSVSDPWWDWDGGQEVFDCVAYATAPINGARAA
jgi:hypothetical protein